MSHWLMGVLAALGGLTGLFMAAHGRDLGIQLFGYVLMAFGVLFCGWMIKTAFDEAEDKWEPRER